MTITIGARPVTLDDVPAVARRREPIAVAPVVRDRLVQARDVVDRLAAAPDSIYGLNSALVDIPKNLGGPQASVTEIDTVLCAQVPCAPTNELDPATVIPNPSAGSPIRTFFRNPTSCAPASATLTASSYGVNQPQASLGAALAADATTITVSGGTGGFPGSGTLLIDSERVAYTGTTATTFTGVTRGADGTIPTTHANGAAIFSVEGTQVSTEPDTYPDVDQGDDPLTSTFTPTGCGNVEKARRHRRRKREEQTA